MMRYKSCRLPALRRVINVLVAVGLFIAGVDPDCKSYTVFISLHKFPSKAHREAASAARRRSVYFSTVCAVGFFAAASSFSGSSPKPMPPSSLRYILKAPKTPVPWTLSEPPAPKTRESKAVFMDQKMNAVGVVREATARRWLCCTRSRVAWRLWRSGRVARGTNAADCANRSTLVTKEKVRIMGDYGGHLTRYR